MHSVRPYDANGNKNHIADEQPNLSATMIGEWCTQEDSNL